MKTKLIRTVEGLLEDGHDFTAHPPLFVWAYEELPEYKFKLLIERVKYNQVEGNNTVN